MLPHKAYYAINVGFRYKFRFRSDHAVIQNSLQSFGQLHGKR